MMMLRRAALLLLLCGLSFTGPVFAATAFPALTGRVVDDAHVIVAGDAAKLSAMLAAHERKTGDQIVVVTLPDLQGQDIADYGYRLGRAWGIGQKDKNNGALLIVVPATHDIRIEVGYGLEGTLTDAASSLIIHNIMVPRIRGGDLSGGIVAGAQAMLAVLGDTDAGPMPAQMQDSQQGQGQPLSLGWIIFILVIVFALRLGGIPLLMGAGFGGGWRRGGDDDFGGGGFSGGGGGFGGGGASGKW